METKDYTIDELIKIFKKHSIDMRIWKIENPPLNSQDDFIICEALLSMCKKLKEHEDRFKYQDECCFDHGIAGCSECD